MGIHHRSLCPNHFPSGDALRQQSSTTSENQTVVQSTQRTSEGAVLAPYTGVGDTTSCLAADELVLMQTASVKLQNLLCNRSTHQGYYLTVAVKELILLNRLLISWIWSSPKLRSYWFAHLVQKPQSIWLLAPQIF